MKSAKRKEVWRRAAQACEYCGLKPDELCGQALQIEHIIARQHGGGDDLTNLALACPWCNSHKGPNLSGIDPISRQTVALFHPRNDAWSEHFEFSGSLIVGLTAIGRATIHVLQMNDSGQIDLRGKSRLEIEE